jgi:hypothetical protein
MLAGRPRPQTLRRYACAARGGGEVRLRLDNLGFRV